MSDSNGTGACGCGGLGGCGGGDRAAAEAAPDFRQVPVNEVIRDHPATLAIFHRHGIDACCGGAVAVEEAARRHGVDLYTLTEELRRAAAPA